MVAVAWAGLVVCGGGLLFVVWEAMRSPRAYRRRIVRFARRANLHPELTKPQRDYLLAQGWPAEVLEAMSTGPYTVTSQVYRNGTTQIWLKRRSAA